MQSFVEEVMVPSATSILLKRIPPLILCNRQLLKAVITAIRAITPSLPVYGVGPGSTECSLALFSPLCACFPLLPPLLLRHPFVAKPLPSSQALLQDNLGVPATPLLLGQHHLIPSVIHTSLYTPRPPSLHFHE